MKKLSVLIILLIVSLTLMSCEQKETPNIKDDDIIVDDVIDDDPVDDEPVDDDPVIDIMDGKFDESFITDLDDILDDAGDIYNLYGISISVDGEIIRELHFRSRDEQSKNNVFSVTKSVTSLLVGIAIDNGFIESVEQSIGDYIDLSQYETDDDLSAITIRHLLTMSAGIYWDDENLSSEMINLRSNENPMDLILGRGLSYVPGTEFNYSDGSAHLVSVILAEATSMPTEEFAEQYLFTPLGIDSFSWNADQNGINIGGCDLFLSNLQMDIIGNLILNKGMHNGVRVVSEEWINESTSNQISSFAYHLYGYYWWLSNKWGVPLISARGWGGQQIYIVPDLNLVVTSSSNGFVSDSTAGSQYVEIEDMVVNEIIKLFIEKSMEE
ncbi:beta-lactamase family protein [Candidatus Izimaplasma bacterium]|nr:beta-lactamase family protein [Candidatus Izimaplasma bacterium]